MELLSMDKARELGRVPNEEDRPVVGMSDSSHLFHMTENRYSLRVIKDPVKNALLRSELDRKATRIASLVCGLPATSDGRETHGDRSTGTLLEDVRYREVLSKVGRGFEEA
jgi:hypothetical protein